MLFRSLITESQTSTVVTQRFDAEVNRFGHIELTRRAQAKED